MDQTRFVEGECSCVQMQQSGRPVFVDTFLPESVASFDLDKSTARDFSCLSALVL